MKIRTVLNSPAKASSSYLKIYLIPEEACQMHCAAILALMLFMVAARVPAASALLLLAPLAEMDRQQPPASGDSGGKLSADHETAAQKPNPDASGKYHVGDGVSAPKLIFAPDPEFTDKARRKQLGGMLVVSLTVDAAGKPQDVRVTRSLAEGVSKKLRPIALGMDENAVKSVKEYRFEPAEYQGKPVPVETSVEIDYRIY
jgi:TonB family protein